MKALLVFLLVLGAFLTITGSGLVGRLPSDQEIRQSLVDTWVASQIVTVIVSFLLLVSSVAATVIGRSAAATAGVRRLALGIVALNAAALASWWYTHWLISERARVLGETAGGLF